MKELTAKVFNREVRARGSLDRGGLLGQSDEWLNRLIGALDLKGEQHKNGLADIASCRWRDDGKIEVLVYLVNDEGKRYFVDDKAATEWVVSPLRPPAGLERLARTPLS